MAGALEFVPCPAPAIGAAEVRARRREGRDAAPRLPDHPRACFDRARIPAVDSLAKKGEIHRSFGLEVREVSGVGPAPLPGMFWRNEKIWQRDDPDPRADRGDKPGDRGAKKSAAACGN